MRKREIHRREPSRAAKWIVGILITLMGVGLVVILVPNPEIAALLALAIACVGALVIALKVKARVRNEWWPRFVERRMMAILGDSVDRLRKETGKVEIPAVWSSSLKNAILEAMHELASRDRQLARLLEHVANMTTEHERLEHARLTLGSLLDRLAEVTEAIYDTPGRDLVRQNADGDTVPNTAILLQIRYELGVSVISTATIVGISPDEILEHWAGMSPAAKQMLSWHRNTELGRPLPEDWVRAIENRIVQEDLARQPPPGPTELAPA